MDNKQIAKILRETAELLQIDGAIIGRYRSYEKAAELIDTLAERVEKLVETPEKLEELPGIGERMVEHLTEIVKTGDYALRKKLLKKYPETILQVLELQSLGPKKAAFLWSEFKAGSVDDVEKLAKSGKLRDLPGFGEKSEQNILKAVEVFKKSTGRFLISRGEDAAEKIGAFIEKYGKLIESVTPAGSLRRGKETIGDLDLLVTLAEEKKAKNTGRSSAATTRQTEVDALAEYILKYPGIEQTLAHGENKVSFTLGDGLQVDVRMLEKENFGAALLYFTGSKEHNVVLRGRANDMGWTLNEYELAELKEESGPSTSSGASEKEKKAAKGKEAGSKEKQGRPGGTRETKGGKRIAGRTEEEIYERLKLEFVPPELRENTGEIVAAEKHKLPKLIERKDIKGDLQMHSTASDGKNSIEEMAEAARKLGHEYIAITDHSKAVTVANGLSEKRMEEHAQRLRTVDKKGLGIRVLVGSEVDILKNGALDYPDEILEQLDVVVCSVHSYFNLDRAAMTERMLAAIENPYCQIIGHPTGRLLLKRDPLDYDMEKLLDACAKHGVAMECNSYPDRLDLKDVYLRMCKEKGVKVVISTDSHTAGNLAFIRYGVTMARRGWLEKKDVMNTLPCEEFLRALRAKPGSKKRVASGE